MEVSSPNRCLSISQTLSTKFLLSAVHLDKMETNPHILNCVKFLFRPHSPHLRPAQCSHSFLLFSTKLTDLAEIWNQWLPSPTSVVKLAHAHIGQPHRSKSKRWTSQMLFSPLRCVYVTHYFNKLKKNKMTIKGKRPLRKIKRKRSLWLNKERLK